MESALERLIGVWDRYDSYLVLGEEKIGKTTFLNECEKKADLDIYYPLRLDGHSEYRNSYAPFQLTMLNVGSKALFAKQIGDKAIEGALKETKIPFNSLIGLLVNHNEIRRNNKLLTLSDIERKIISQINMVVKGKQLLVIADNYHYWDEMSRKLLSFLMTKQAKDALPFLVRAKFIISSVSKPDDSHFQYTAELLPCMSYESFSSQLKIYLPNEDDAFYEQLYSITGGNLGQAKEISEFVSLSEYRFHANSASGSALTTRLLHSVLEERVKVITKSHPHFISTIESAAVLGKRFDSISLHKFHDIPHFEIIDRLTVADKYKIIRKYRSTQNAYEFYNILMYSFFYEMTESRRKEYHLKFAQFFERLRQFDYYKKYYHFYHAGMTEKAYEMFSIHLIRQRQRNIPVAPEHIDLLKKEGGKYFDSFTLMDKALSAKHFSKAKKYLDCFDASYGTLTLFEKDYSYAVIVSAKGISEEYNDVYELLNHYFLKLRVEFFDYWVRFGIFLLIFCVNRIGNFKRSKEIEKELVYELAKRCGEDSHWEMLVHILNRNSSSIYNTEVALIKVKRSYDYFLSHIDEDPENYVMAATNYAGLLIVASEYVKAYELSKCCLYELNERNLFITRIDKLLNNHIVSGYLSKELTVQESIELFDKTLEADDLDNKPLIANNYYLMVMYNGDMEKSLLFFKNQYYGDKINKHNDYYRYLYGVNYMALLIASNHYDDAMQIYISLDSLIPAIMSSECDSLLERYKAFEQILEENRLFTSPEEMAASFRSYCDSDTPYLNNPFIFTDQQYWSIL